MFYCSNFKPFKLEIKFPMWQESDERGMRENLDKKTLLSMRNFQEML